MHAKLTHQVVRVASDDGANVAEDVMHITAGDTDTSDRNAPTVRAYGEMIYAYNFFNANIFERLLNQRLPDALITFRSHSLKTKSYFHGSRFGHRSNCNRSSDEIAMNPRFFRGHDVKYVLSHLVGEMVHVYIHHFVHASRNGYRNRHWANAALKIGLHPTADGSLDGRQTGQGIEHLIVVGGPFDRAADALLAEGFTLSWYDRDNQLSLLSSADNTENSCRHRRSGVRVRFTCPRCSCNAWGKETLNIFCGNCNQKMGT